MPEAVLAERVLFEPLAPWLTQLPGQAPPYLDRLDRFLQTSARPPTSGGGVLLRFVAAAAGGMSYERSIFETGCVPTRPGNWHDAFNALVWLRFPSIKAALNARHVRAQCAESSRGAARDAATLFDESGVIVASADASLTEALRAHRWRQVFVERRSDLERSLRFVVFGHAVYDQLRAPFFGLCGKALFVSMSAPALVSPRLLSQLDDHVAGRLADPAFLATPRDLSPLPLLGIPGVTEASEDPAYYDDLRQFRPVRRSRQAFGTSLDSGCKELDSRIASSDRPRSLIRKTAVGVWKRWRPFDRLRANGSQRASPIG